MLLSAPPPSCRQPAAAGSPSPSDVCVEVDGWPQKDKDVQLPSVKQREGAPPSGMKLPPRCMFSLSEAAEHVSRPQPLLMIADAGLKVGTVKDASVNDKHQRRGPAVRGGPRNAPQPGSGPERSQFFHSDAFQDRGDGFVFHASSTYEPVWRPGIRRSGSASFCILFSRWALLPHHYRHAASATDRSPGRSL